MTRKIDLDALAAAQGEAQKESIEVSFKGESFTLPSALPWRIARVSDEQGQEPALRLLFGEAQYEKFEALDPEYWDMHRLWNEAMKLYGLGHLVVDLSPSNGQVGEVRASGSSPSSLSDTGPSSRPTSSTSTE